MVPLPAATSTVTASSRSPGDSDDAVSAAHAPARHSAPRRAASVPMVVPSWCSTDDAHAADDASHFPGTMVGYDPLDVMICPSAPTWTIHVGGSTDPALDGTPDDNGGPDGGTGAIEDLGKGNYVGNYGKADMQATIKAATTPVAFDVRLAGIFDTYGIKGKAATGARA